MKFYYQDQDRMMRFMKPVSIWDAQGNVMYTMRTHKGLGLGYQLDLFDAYGDQIAEIRQKIGLLRSNITVQTDGQEWTFHIRHTLKNGAICEIGGIGWTLDGFVMRREYGLYEGQKLIAVVHAAASDFGYQKDYRSLLDHHMRASAKTFDPAACCEVEIAEDMAVEEVLAAVMGIEAAIIAANDNNNST